MTNPYVYRDLVSKLCSSQRSHPIRYQEALKLPYLEAIISETLRTYSPVGFPGSRVVSLGGVKVFGHFVSRKRWSSCRSVV
jgi:cytochrome P450